MKIGVLALQGGFAEHTKILQHAGVQTRLVRLPEQLDGLDGLVIPGGESTTIGKLAVRYGLVEPLRRFGQEKAVWGTCAGAILLSKDANRSQPLLELMDITVARNAFGRQLASFEMDLEAPFLTQVDPRERPFRAIFIRAPLIESVQGRVQTLVSIDGKGIVAAQQGKLLATSFHPELGEDDRFHRYFLELVRS
jgi:pyridoxal 5'-phosphate synthase pdxT subunit